MKSPSRTLVNWIALGLIVLFIWILLAAIIAPRLRGTTPGAGDLDVTATSPDANATTTALYAPTPTALYWALPSGALITTEQIGQIPAGTRVLVQNVTYTPDGWVYSIATLDYSEAADVRENQLSLDPAFDASAPTPAPRYSDPAYWGMCYPLVLTEDITADPAQPDDKVILAGTRVAIGSYEVTPIYVEGHGYTYRYSIVAQPRTSAGASVGTAQPYLGGFAYEYQLAPAEGVDIAVGMPTPTSPFGGDWMSTTAYITIEDVGGIPAGTSVSIGSAYLACDHWVYDIYAGDSTYAQAREDQIAIDPNYTPEPTSTYPPATPTTTSAVVETIGDPYTVIRSAPTLDENTILAEVPPGTQLAVIGRWLGYDWYQVVWADSPTGTAWVYAPLVVLIGDETLIPAVTPQITPSP